MTARGVGVVTVLAFTVFASMSASGCNGDSFTSGSEGGNGGTFVTGGAAGQGAAYGGGAGGSPSTGGTAGDTSSGGRAGADASGGGEGGLGRSGEGTGGLGEAGRGEGGEGGESSCSDTKACPEGRYCDAQGACRLCTDITTLDDPGAARFGAAEPLSAINDAAGDFMLRTPRVFGSGNALLYVRDFLGGEIWLTGDMDHDVGAPLPSPVNDPGFVEGSPLWIARSDGAFEEYNFVFNRAASSTSPYEFQLASLDPSGTAGAVTRAPAPYNAGEPLTESRYSMAVSRDRAWWTVNRDLLLGLQFQTAPLDRAGPPSVVPLPYSETCEIVEFDFGAWVTPDGKLLFVNARERNADCTPPSGEPHDVVVFKLDEAGQVLGHAVPVNGVSHSGSNESDGSLSGDMCTFYFVANVKDKLRIMRAKREG